MFSLLKAHVSIEGPAEEIINLTQTACYLGLANCHSSVDFQKPLPKVEAGDTKDVHWKQPLLSQTTIMS
jgi:hypothetical protein